MKSEIKLTQKYNPETHLEEIEYSISKEDLDKAFNSALDKVTSEATAPGFRKGKVPKATVLQQNMQQITDRAVDEAIQKSVRNFPELDPRPLDQLHIKSVTPAEDGSLNVVLTYVPMPSVTLGDLTKVKVAAPTPKEVADEEVDREVASVWLHYATKADPEAKREDFDPKKLDDDFFKTSGIQNDNPQITDFDSLQQFIRDYISNTYKADADMGWEREVQDAVIKGAKFEKVEALIERELEKRVSDYKSRFTQIGMNADEYMSKNNVKEEDLKKEWRPAAERDVKLEIILQSYGAEKGIEPSEVDYKENLASLDANTRKMYNDDETKLRALIRYYFINQKAYNDIIAQVKGTEGSDQDKPKKAPAKKAKAK